MTNTWVCPRCSFVMSSTFGPVDEEDVFFCFNCGEWSEDISD